ncbi:FAD-dependent monooxygenase [Lutimaribacter sp. EGI FJ00015]|uniref:FAD-dependent monooxygenase n=1 Tax=Lutimaribacter degradans TaxID=2945989 RepID=A0ACC5ZYH6_9RHOB|nr:FAD-dependent monooxygenase [Lutimaribacter sp. EGI FJ00013]MCM2562409.1 FAD-dependent monooxygenase [Lutimaribacter sp. EGI FJ00013]MCO0613566.1 FAD-dependent monooxygenase [Lutimaribacter sp. EGI FJ00015]MCO0636538.1 FAD-dependent monooxygenase [Lutimaribacter sp. EGI FJ00014]
MNSERLRVLVIGGGIGGLAVARALAMDGASVTVLEQASEIAEVGAGIQISPNGFAVLRALGLDRDVVARSVRGQSVSLRDFRAGEVLKLDLTQLKRHEYYFVHRADLIDILLKGARAAGVKIRLLQQVERVEPGPRPRVVLKNGDTREADLVIGADGLHSVMRPALNDAAKPFFTRQVAWRAVVPNIERRGPQVQVHMGPGRHVVSYPLRDGNALNIVAVREQRDWVAESWTQDDDPANLQAAFADFGADVRAMLGRVQTVRQWGLFRHVVAARWQGGHCALLGDAAHPTLPFLAQGACMALEDAWGLRLMLQRAPDLETGLSQYQQLRISRARRVIAAASRNAWKYHLRFPPLRGAAHMALRLGGAVAPERMLHQFDWLYDYDITSAA